LRGTADVPGDKSISHRALIAGVCCNGPLRVGNLNTGRDVAATRSALESLGASIEHNARDVVVHPSRLHSPQRALDCMNSGSTARMLLGACAGAAFAATFDGDDSLRRRPMEPVAAQLRAFGARIETQGGRLPMRLLGRSEVETQHFILLAPSAQVKSALLFAGLFAGVKVRVDGDRGSRDHTERLLAYLGARVAWDARGVTLEPATLESRPISIVGDFSAAAFFITAAAIAPGSAIVVRDVGVNPTRTGLLDALRRMGAGIELRNERTISGEPMADVAVEHGALRSIAVDSDLALRAVDELPLIAIAAAFAEGTTTVAGVGALRSKESDRLAATERLLGAVGIATAISGRTLHVTGGAPHAIAGACVATEEDHRTVMAAAVLASAAGEIRVDGARAADVSFPGFTEALERLQG
jgi:3-phosphoshikimate 1-carboxyvinyltransferase